MGLGGRGWMTDKMDLSENQTMGQEKSICTNIGFSSTLSIHNRTYTSP